MKTVFDDAFWKAVAETAYSHGFVEASVVVYNRVHGMTVNECCAAAGLGAKHVKSILKEFDRYSASVIPVGDADKLSA